MNNELRSGRLIGGLFTFPCFGAAVICFVQSSAHPGFLWLGLLFALGGVMGVRLLRRPPVLVRVTDTQLELYPGSLFSNRRQIVVPIKEIEDFEVRTVSDGDGTSWLLLLHVRGPRDVGHEAQRWIDAHVPRKIRDQADEKTILWILSWPEGGVRGAEEKIGRLIESGVPTLEVDPS